MVFISSLSLLIAFYTVRPKIDVFNRRYDEAELLTVLNLSPNQEY